jgi:hypothetical protein
MIRILSANPATKVTIFNSFFCAFVSWWLNLFDSFMESSKLSTVLLSVKEF